jgi:L,D-peptidoglycan transpeptidase YkuD (ErfK/YbiS/YcfS/YnhG family)
MINQYCLLNKIKLCLRAILLYITLGIIYITSAQANSLIKDIPTSVNQLILVTPFNKFQAHVSLWQKKNNTWIMDYTAMPAVIGSEGVVAPKLKFEGDQKTPTGLYALGPVFSTQPLKVKMDYKYITAQDKYIDDPNNSSYNQWVTGNTTAKSFEVMDRKYGVYDAGIIINYNNNPVIKNKGSAIFMHI